MRGSAICDPRNRCGTRPGNTSMRFTCDITFTAPTRRWSVPWTRFKKKLIVMNGLTSGLESLKEEIRLTKREKFNPAPPVGRRVLLDNRLRNAMDER